MNQCTQYLESIFVDIFEIVVNLTNGIPKHLCPLTYKEYTVNGLFKKINGYTCSNKRKQVWIYM